MKNDKFLHSVSFAADGMREAFRAEKNVRREVFMAIAVVCCSVVFGLSGVEKAIVITLCALVLCAELFNTSIERAVDLASPEYSALAKAAKDTAAAGVLIISAGAAAAGLVIFVPRGLAALAWILSKL